MTGVTIMHCVAEMGIIAAHWIICQSRKDKNTREGEEFLSSPIYSKYKEREIE